MLLKTARDIPKIIAVKPYTILVNKIAVLKKGKLLAWDILVILLIFMKVLIDDNISYK